MANLEHLGILRQGVSVWNLWRNEHRETRPDFVRAPLNKANLAEADLSGADFSGAALNNANFKNANLSEINLRGADLRGAWLHQANCYRADLREADLSRAYLIRTNLIGAQLTHARLNGATVGLTQFSDVDLSQMQGLETVDHYFPSSVDIDTLYRSKGQIPEIFLRKVGVPEDFITYMHSLVSRPIDYYTCFISYSSKDQDFVKRLYAHLLNENVRCWYAPEKLEIGDEIRPRIDETIRLYDKLLLVLSEHSVASNWVAYEVKKALDKEPLGLQNVLYPIRIDDAVMHSKQSWVRDILGTLTIGDFTRWKEHDAYQHAFRQLLRSLKLKR